MLFYCWKLEFTRCQFWNILKNIEKVFWNAENLKWNFLVCQKVVCSGSGSNVYSSKSERIVFLFFISRSMKKGKNFRKILKKWKISFSKILRNPEETPRGGAVKREKGWGIKFWCWIYFDELISSISSISSVIKQILECDFWKFC